MVFLRHLGTVGVVLTAFTVLFAACTKEKAADSTAAEVPAADPLAERGGAVYAANCTACHGTNPKSAGPLGPDIAGSSLALLEARIMTAGYPAGYTPKRKSQAMVALPHLKGDIPALYAFLNKP